MSYAQDADDVERPAAGGSIRRAKERAEAGGPREDFASFVKRMAQTAQAQQEPQQQQQSSVDPTERRIPIPSSARRDLAGETGTWSSPPPSAPGSSRIPIPKAQPSAKPQTKDAPVGVAISRPTPAPQWPLATPVNAASSPNATGGRIGPSRDAEPYRPPPGRSQPPQRPPRPSRVPSILDSSKIQDQMPTVFAYNTVTQARGPGASGGLQPPPGIKEASRGSDMSLTQQSLASSASRPSTVSSVGSIPDFPVPVAGPVAIPVPPPVAGLPLPRRSVNLGPPPSARRGASSFYSNASYVSPIPEESPRSRSHTSLASSAAMPDNWASSSSLALSPNYPDASSVYEDIPEETRESLNDTALDEDRSDRSGPDSTDGDHDGDHGANHDGYHDGYHDGDEKHLVRSASIGKRGKAALVTTGPFRESTGYMDASPSSSATAVPSNKALAGSSSLTADNILDLYDAATASDPSNLNRRTSLSPRPPSTNANFESFDFGGPSRPYSRLSAIRRPPRLDIDAVHKAEARGSLTSLPDLIRRATRLAASLERGKRPASRFDDLDMSPGMYGSGAANHSEGDTEKYRSGLSDMLAAFPPPGQPANQRSFRQSLREQVGSWPLPLNLNNIRNSRLSGQPNRTGQDGDEETSSELTDLKNQRQRKGRRCCGLPLCGFVLVVIAILIVVAAAIVIPLELLVIRKQNTNNSKSALAQCRSQLTCANGGTNVVSTQGFCSCICANDFTGFDCSIVGDNGCTTTALTSSSTTASLTNVTVGNALPRLIEQAQQNFSIPLSGTDILAVFNSGNLSCAAENALVTFDGETTRQSNGTSEPNAFAAADGSDSADSSTSVVNGVAIVTVTIEANAVTAVVKAKRGTGPSTLVTAPTTAHATGGQVFPTVSGTTLTFSTQITPSIILPTSTTTVTTTVTPTKTISSGGAGGGGGGGPATGTGSSVSPLATFTVTEDVLDFARVAVLFILQQESLSNAESAQSTLQRFFTQASEGSLKDGPGVSTEQARNLTLVNGNSINLVNFQVSVANALRGANVPT